MKSHFWIVYIYDCTNGILPVESNNRLQLSDEIIELVEDAALSSIDRSFDRHREPGTSYVVGREYVYEYFDVAKYDFSCIKDAVVEKGYSFEYTPNNKKRAIRFWNGDGHIYEMFIGKFLE